jgi:hypothetical protein
MTEATVWHQEQKTSTDTEYYILLKDGEKTVSIILKHNSEKNEVRADPYLPPDIDYAIHDGCNHEEDECFENYPGSEESQDIYMAERYARAVNALETQLKQQKIADQLSAAKAQQ